MLKIDTTANHSSDRMLSEGFLQWHGNMVFRNGTQSAF